MSNPNLARTTRRELMAGAAAVGVAAALPAQASQDATLHEVEIRNFRFTPNPLEVRAGDTIRWINRDRAPHDATGRDRSWNTPVMERNQYTELTATVEMSGEYLCSIHPQMRATLTVTA